MSQFDSEVIEKKLPRIHQRSLYANERPNSRSNQCTGRIYPSFISRPSGLTSVYPYRTALTPFSREKHLRQKLLSTVVTSALSTCAINRNNFSGRFFCARKTCGVSMNCAWRSASIRADLPDEPRVSTDVASRRTGSDVLRSFEEKNSPSVRRPGRVDDSLIQMPTHPIAVFVTPPFTQILYDGVFRDRAVGDASRPLRAK